jgi:hypothetical protein
VRDELEPEWNQDSVPAPLTPEVQLEDEEKIPHQSIDGEDDSSGEEDAHPVSIKDGAPNSNSTGKGRAPKFSTERVRRAYRKLSRHGRRYVDHSQYHRQLKSSAGTVETTKSSRLAAGSDSDERFAIFVSGPEPHDSCEFTTRSKYLVKKVLLTVCKTFKLDADRFVITSSAWVQ